MYAVGPVSLLAIPGDREGLTCIRVGESHLNFSLFSALKKCSLYNKGRKVNKLWPILSATRTLATRSLF